MLQLKASAEAKGITEKAEAMKLSHDAAREHEEFKLRLSKERDVDLATIQTQAHIASSQASVVSEARRRMEHGRRRELPPTRNSAPSASSG